MKNDNKQDKAYIINFSINNIFDMWYKLCFALGEL